MIRLDKYLADMGYGTRSELKKEIRKGQASVNSETIRDPGYLLNGTECVFFKGNAVRYEKYSYFMLNKPAGVISATEDREQKTVLSLLKTENAKDLFPVGRLDKDTEGLLLLTNDGDLAHRLLSPKHHVDKTYYVKCDGPLTQDDVQLFSRGLSVSPDFTAMPSTLAVIKTGEESEAIVTIQEGKFHQVKRMFHAVGNEVLYLKRLSMGSLVLDEKLAPGEYRRLTENEIRELKEIR